jgi:P-type E1-E2 ATPase
VKVIREGEVQSLPCRELVPGDLLIPEGEVPCDALMIQGSAFVNEANLTGESNPVGKFSMTSMNSIYEHQSWLY